MERQEDAVLPFVVRMDDVGFWLEEWDRVRALPEAELEQVLAHREERYARNHAARPGLRLALLLSAGPAPVRDHERASSILKKIDLSGEEPGARALAALLEQMIAEQQWSSDKIAELRALLKESAARVEELERQLQELTDIEQSIQQRN